MTHEIERRWLVPAPPPEAIAAEPLRMVQTYLPTGLRARATTSNAIVDHPVTVYHLTVKKRITDMTNHEVEIVVPAEIYEAIIPHRTRVLSKTRRRLSYGVLLIELDQFEDGLWIAEIELPSEDYPVTIPDWFGQEITGDKAYTNYAMAKHV